MTYPFAKFATLQRAAAQSLSYAGGELAEAIMHHCALKVASATAPTDEMVGRYVTAEIKAKNALLRMPVADIEGIAVRGRYLRALSKSDEWEKDDGTIGALVAGLAVAGKSRAPS